MKIAVNGECILCRYQCFLLDQHILRALDAIQLACAVYARDLLDEPMTVLSADNNLLLAAAAEGFGTDNPNNHP